MEWFSAALKDSQTRKFIFSGPSIKTLNEVRSVPRWVRWLRERVEESERLAQEAVQRELERQRPEGAEGLEPKWLMTLRIYSESHSIRASSLNTWNDADDSVKLKRARADELILELTMPKAVVAGAVWPASYTLTQRLLLAFNIGTFGFFWWQKRQHTQRFYERLTDLETNDEVVIERSPSLIIDWGAGQVLDERTLNRVRLCMAMLPLEDEVPGQEAFGHYLRGLALIAKSDIHLQLDANIFASFLTALREGMRLYGTWDGEEPYVDVFATFIERFEKDDDERARYVAAVTAAEAGDLSVKLTFDQVVILKGLADAFFVETFDRLATERMRVERQEQ
jgi:hypothetical protein